MEKDSFEDLSVSPVLAYLCKHDYLRSSAEIPEEQGRPSYNPNPTGSPDLGLPRLPVAAYHRFSRLCAQPAGRDTLAAEAQMPLVVLA